MWNGVEKKKKTPLLAYPSKYRAGVHGGLSTCGRALGTRPPSVLPRMRNWAKTRNEVCVWRPWVQVLRMFVLGTECITSQTALGTLRTEQMVHVICSFVFLPCWFFACGERERELHCEVTLWYMLVLGTLQMGIFFNRPCMYGLIFMSFLFCRWVGCGSGFTLFWIYFILAHCKYNI